MNETADFKFNVLKTKSDVYDDYFKTPNVVKNIIENIIC